MVTKRVIVRGVVQGVGYRYFTQRVAERFNLNGYVRNLPDGSVEVIVQLSGEPDFDAFLRMLRQGPRAATVEQVEVETLTKFPERLAGFRVRL